MSSQSSNVDAAIYSQPHRRLNPLTREWVLVSPQRNERPWQGQVERQETESLAPYDPSCYLCPGNERAGGHRNPKYSETFVFENDFAALRPDAPRSATENHDELLVARPESGICRVVCFSPRHDLTLARMMPQDIRRVVNTWSDEIHTLGQRQDINYVQIFENRGALMGCSNPHPHGQIWATSAVPNEPLKEQNSLSEYAASRGSCLLCDYLEREQKSAERMVCENESFVAVVPFWAVWPFEVMLLSKRHVSDLTLLDETERSLLADALKRITVRYDNLFQISFPYSMGFHQRPTDGASHEEWHLHAHFFPPLLRSASVKKFMVGYELLAMPQRDLTQESAAVRLSSLSERHFLEDVPSIQR